MSGVLLTLNVVAPVFALILAGMFAARLKVMTRHVSDGLNHFVVWLALPALLFKTVAQSRWETLWQPDYILVYGGSAIATLLLAMCVARYKKYHPTDAALAGLNACYSNVGYIGFPIAVALLGAPALLPTTISAVMGMCVFFAAVIVMIEIGLHADAAITTIATRVIKSLTKHPLVVAPVCGIPFVSFNIALPVPAIQFLDLLSAAAAPCALVAVGMFIMHQRAKLAAGSHQMVAVLVTCKLIVHPLLAWLLATVVFDLPSPMTHAAVLMAALPTGTGSFMLAEYYGRDAGISSRVTVVSTLLGIVSMTVIMAMVAVT